MSKVLRYAFQKIGVLLLMLALVPGALFAAPTKFTSPNYQVESLIFGGTGTLRSSYASIPPVITAGPVAGSITTSSATIQWTTDKPSNSIVLLGTTSGSYPVQTGNLTSATFTNHSVNLSSLTKGTVYYYRVRSADVSGNVVQSAEHTFTTDPGDILAPEVLSGPTVSNNSATSVTVTWETNELSNSVVQYGTSRVDEFEVGRSDELTLFHQIQISGLQPSQQYMFRIRSRDSSDNTYTSPIQELTTLSAPSITEVTITDVTLNSAIVQWKTTTPTTSTVQYGTSQEYSNVLEDADTLSDNHIMRLSGLQNGTVYHLRISGVDVAGTRLTSDDYVFRTVILPTINDFKVSEVTSSSAFLNWLSSSEIDELIRYEITGSLDPDLVGKQGSAGNDKLVTEHSFLLGELSSGSTYRVSVVGKDVFGNQAISQSLEFTTLPDQEPPEILNIKSDTTVDLGGRQTVQILVSFGLSEPGIAVIEYGEGATGDFTNTVTTDTEISQNKFMVIPALRPGQSYHYRIRATDRAGNERISAEYLALAPSQPLSLVDLIFGQVRANFGWLSRLGNNQ